MKIPDAILAESFTRAGLTREVLHNALRIMCPAELKGYNAATTREMREQWTSDNPTRFCCYFVSEMVYWYLAPQGSRAMALAVPGDSTPHRYVEWPDRAIVDITCDQFDHYEDLNYSLAKPSMFLQTGGIGPSKRAQYLATLLHVQRKS